MERTTDSPTADALLEAARRGDTRALESLLQREAPRIYRFGKKMCRGEADAEDVVQETMLAAARTLGDFRGGSSLSTWLYTIARSFCIKKRRRSKFAPAEEGSLDGDAAGEARTLADGSPDPEQRTLTRELAEALAAAIEELDPQSREVLVLRDAEGLSAKEVADVVGTSEAAVKSRLHRARALVRARMAPLLGGAAEDREGCPDVVELFSKHVEGEISADACADMERHLAACAKCRRACDTLQETLALCRRGTGAAVPASVQASVRRAIVEFLKVP